MIVKQVYKRLYICPLCNKCDNRACFMRNPHNRKEYYKELGGISFNRCIEDFNKVFGCGGQKLNLLEVDFSRRTAAPAPHG